MLHYAFKNIQLLGKDNVFVIIQFNAIVISLSYLGIIT